MSFRHAVKKNVSPFETDKNVPKCMWHSTYICAWRFFSFLFLTNILAVYILLLLDSLLISPE